MLNPLYIVCPCSINLRHSAMQESICVLISALSWLVPIIAHYRATLKKNYQYKFVEGLEFKAERLKVALHASCLLTVLLHVRLC